MLIFIEETSVLFILNSLLQTIPREYLASYHVRFCQVMNNHLGQGVEEVLRKQQTFIQNLSSYQIIRILVQGIAVSQGCRSGSELDPDSFGSVDPDPYSESGSGSRRAKMTHKSRKIKKFHVLKCWMYSFDS
jgi:hypothetical protein